MEQPFEAQGNSLHSNADVVPGDPDLGIDRLPVHVFFSVRERGSAHLEGMEFARTHILEKNQGEHLDGQR